MLGSLFKYDFKALGRMLWPLQLGVFVAGLFGSFLIGMSFRAASQSWNSSSYSSNYGSFETIVSSASSAIGSLIFAAVFASSLVTLFLIARHYYKNFFGDEGYLTFTLPVKTGQLMWSKMLSGTLWMIINTIVILLVCVALSLFGFSTSFINPDVVEMYGELFAAIATPLGSVLTLEIVLLVIVSHIVNVLLVFAAISIGSAVAKTQKALASVGFYVLFNFILSTVVSVIMVASMFNFIDMLTSYRSTEWFPMTQTFIVPFLICMVIFGFVLYFVGRQPLRKNLNLN